MIICNIFKHHFKETINIINQYYCLNKTEKEILKIFNKIGNNEFDLYTGNFRIKEIIYFFCNNIISCNSSPKDKGYFICKDHSVWIYKYIYKKNKKSIHIHPARNTFIKELKKENLKINSELILRLHSNLYKTILMLYWFYLYYHKKNFITFLEFLSSDNIIQNLNTIRNRIHLSSLKNEYIYFQKILNISHRLFNGINQ